MTKNTSGQAIGVQMVSASDGSAFTGSVTCYVTGDAGTQAAGSVGSGACTHEGNGYHTYAPAQAETNYNLIAFTFVGTGAIPVTVQVFTTAWAKSLANVPANVAQFGGSNGTFASGRPEVNVSHFGGTAGTFASGRPNVNTSHVGGTSQTGRDIGASVLLSSGTGTGQISLSSGAVLLQPTQSGVTIPTVTTLTNAPSDSSGVTTLLSRLSSARAGYLDNLSAGAAALESSVQSVITTLSGMAAAAATAVWSAGTRLLTAGTNIVLAKGTGVTGFTDLDASGVRTAVGLASANLDTQLGTIDNVVDAIKVSTDNLPSDPADQSLIIAATDGIMTRLGSPAGASVSADVAAIKSDTGAILTDTGTTLDGKIDAIKSVTDALPDAGALTSLVADASDAKTAAESADATLTALTEDSSGIRFTEKALEEAPTGGGGGATPEEIADAVWDEDLTGHTTADSAGYTLGNVATGTPPSATAIADEVQTRTIAAVTTVGSVSGNVGGNVSGSVGSLAAQAKSDVRAEADAALAAYDAPTKSELDSAVAPLATSSALAVVDGVVDDILADTADMQPKLGSPAGASISADIAAVKAQTAAIEADTQDLQTQVGTDGAGLTALPWNAAWDAEVQSECTDALNAYDPPTKAELDAAVAPLATGSAVAGLPSAADVATAVQASATSNPLAADVKAINATPVVGDGSVGDPWGPA